MHPIKLSRHTALAARASSCPASSVGPRRRGLLAAAALIGALAHAPGLAQVQPPLTPLPVVATAASSAQLAFLGPQNLVSMQGLVADPAQPGVFRLQTSATTFNSGYGTPNDETPLVHFDLGATQTLDRFHVWNVNAHGFTWRGFRDVTVQYSDDALRWTTLPDRIVFAQAPGRDDYTGQRVVLSRTVTARFIRFVCNTTWRNGGNPDIASLGRVMFFAGGSPAAAPAEDGPWPRAAGVVNVKEAPYFARGDGRTDDTAALQQAIRDHESRGRTIYLPEGVYLISAPLRFTENSSSNRNSRFGRNTLRGENTADTVIRLRDQTFTDPLRPQAVLNNGYISFFNGRSEETVADWFHNHVSDLTIDIGRGNPGAKGLEFFSNNTGSVRNVRIVSRDGQGTIGLDLGHLDKNGPLLVKGLTVVGFDVGVRTGNTVNSQTLEDINLQQQRVTALDNDGQALAIRNLRTSGNAMALRNRFGHVTLVDAVLQGGPAAAALAAMDNGEFLTLRNVAVSGFNLAVRNRRGGAPDLAGSVAGDWTSHGTALQLFPGSGQSLRLPVAATPELEDLPAALWVNARDWRLTTETDDALALQRAVDNGAMDVYVPSDARVVLKSDVILRGAVRQVHLMQSRVESVGGARLRVADGGAPTLVVRDAFIQGGSGFDLVNESSRRLVVLDSELAVRGSGRGPVFLENVVGRFEFGSHAVWARQLNSEPEGLKISNHGGRLWVLGLKTERAGTAVATRAGGSTEVLGGLVYTTTSSVDPLFTVDDARLSASLAEVAYGPPPYQTLVRETRHGATRSLLRGQAPLRFDFMNGSALPLFVANP